MDDLTQAGGHPAQTRQIHTSQETVYGDAPTSNGQASAKEASRSVERRNERFGILLAGHRRVSVLSGERRAESGESKSRAPFDDLTSQDKSPLPYVLESQLDKSGLLYAMESSSAKKQAPPTPLTAAPRPPPFQACVRGTRAPQNLPAQPNLKLDLQKSIIEAKEVDLNDEQETENHRYPDNTHENEEAEANNLNRNLSSQVSKDESLNGKERVRHEPGDSSTKTKVRLVTMENSDEHLEQPSTP